MKKVLLVTLFVLFSISLVSADVIQPGYRNIVINNMITNINDYPDYIFITVGNINPGMCPIKVVGSDGLIPSGYKNCAWSVYAIKKSGFNQNDIDALNNRDSTNSQEAVNQYISIKGGIKVIDNIRTYAEVPVTSTEKSRSEYYKVDLGNIQNPEPNVVAENNSLIYLYIIIPVIALFIILFLIIRKKK